MPAQPGNFLQDSMFARGKCHPHLQGKPVRGVEKYHFFFFFHLDLWGTKSLALSQHLQTAAGFPHPAKTGRPLLGLANLKTAFAPYFSPAGFAFAGIRYNGAQVIQHLLSVLRFYIPEVLSDIFLDF